MMVVMSRVMVLQMALFILADLGLGLQHSVADAVLLQLLPYQVLDGLDIVCAGHDMHCGIVIVAVDAPHMDMMNILNSFYI